MSKTMIVLIILLCLLLFSVSFLIGYAVLAPGLGITINPILFPLQSL